MELSRGAQILLAIASFVVLAEGGYLYYVQTHVHAPTSCLPMVQAWETAESDAASQKTAYTGPIASVNFNSKDFPDAKNFSTAITKAVQGGPNFAGHFTIAEWGCGTACEDHAIVDVVTGNIVAFGIPSEMGLRYSIGSNLIMTNPPNDFPDAAKLASLSFDEKVYWYNIPREYYALTEKDNTVSFERLCIESGFDGR